MASPRPTRFYPGVTNNPPTHPLAGIFIPDPNKMSVFSTDFFQYVAADWTLSGAGTPTSALTAGGNGLLLLSTTAVASDAAFIQKTPGNHVLEANKSSWIHGEFSLADVTTPSFTFGLINAGATVTAPTDGFYFNNAAGGTVFTMNYAVGSAVTTVAFPTNLPATWPFPNQFGAPASTVFSPIVNGGKFFLSARYDGVSKVEFYFNFMPVGSIAVGTNGAALTAVTLAPAVGIVNGGAAIKTATVDFLMTAKERTPY
jgi:hypothetical protein